jgi:class 3 adenylate cyclase
MASILVTLRLELHPGSSTTIVFTDIVESTRRLAGSGDAGWRTLLAEHDRRMDALLVRFDGEAVKHTGDGRLVRIRSGLPCADRTQ